VKRSTKKNLVTGKEDKTYAMHLVGRQSLWYKVNQYSTGVAHNSTYIFL